MGVFVTSILFQWSLLLSLLVTVLLLVIDIELYGFFWIMTGKLNALTLVNLAVAVSRLLCGYSFSLQKGLLTLLVICECAERRAQDSCHDAGFGLLGNSAEEAIDIRITSGLALFLCARAHLLA